MTVALVMLAKSGRRGSVAVVVFERRRGGVLSEIHGEIFESVVSRHDDGGSAAETDAGRGRAGERARAQAVAESPVVVDDGPGGVPHVAYAVSSVVHRLVVEDHVVLGRARNLESPLVVNPQVV